MTRMTSCSLVSCMWMKGANATFGSSMRCGFLSHVRFQTKKGTVGIGLQARQEAEVAGKF